MTTLLFFAIVFLVLGLLHYYIYRRSIQSLEYVSKKWRILFRIIFFVFVPTYFLAKGFSHHLSPLIYEILHFIGSYWFAYLLYIALLILIIDITRLINSLVKIYPHSFYANPEKTKFFAGIGVFAAATVILFFGWLNMREITVTEVEITLPKKSSQLDSLHIAYFSDSHFSHIHDNDYAAEIVRITNGINPDIIFLVGDIIDEPRDFLEDIGIGKELQKLHAPLGVYGCMGNHEYIINSVETSSFLEENGIVMLRDTAVLIDSSFYVLGRDDRSIYRETGKNREELSTLTKSLNRNFPIIVLDHQPFDYDSSINAEIDLKLSGHTHNGQWFPGNLLVGLIYENPYGLYKREGTTFFVSSGAATWGPPIKIGAKVEVVSLRILFK